MSCRSSQSPYPVCHLRRRMAESATLGKNNSQHNSQLACPGLWSLPIPRLIECLQEEGLLQELIAKAMN